MTTRTVGPGGKLPAVPFHEHSADEIFGEATFLSLEADYITGGTITGEEIILAGGTAGILRSSNYAAGVDGWAILGDGSAEFNDVTVRGDIVSSNWNGADPANLSAVDGTATAGFYFDSSEGAAQLEGDLFVGGNVVLEAGGVFSNSSDFANADRIEMGGSFTDIRFFTEENATEVLYAGSIGASGSASTQNLIISAPADSSLTTTLATYILASPGTAVNYAHLFTSSTASGSGSGGNWNAFMRVVDPGGLGNYPTLDILHGVGGTNTGEIISIQDFDESARAAIALKDSVGTYLAELRADTGVWRAPNGSASVPSYSFLNNSDSGHYLETTDVVVAVAGGLEIFRWWVSGGTTPVFESQAINDLTTASAANVNVGASGDQLRRSTSSLRYKPGWKYANEDHLARLEIPTPIFWKEGKEQYLGFGTEHVHESLGRRYVQDDRGSGPELYDLRALVAILSAKVKRLENQLKEIAA